jgi:uncharacterized protein (DUF2236 family)
MCRQNGDNRGMGYLFGPDSMMWRINRESVLLLGGRAALLMQLAHPLVAAGVAEHSNFRSEPIRRLRRTLEVMTTIIFGTEEQAQRVAASVNQLHDRIAGTAPDGRAYRARDPRLLLWVYATLVDSSIKVYEACVESLTAGELARYYDEGKDIARLFEIPEDHIPGTHRDLKEWMRGMIDSGEVVVTPLARQLAGPIIRPLRLVPQRLAASSAVVTAALLPPPIREGYGLRVSRPASALLALGRRTSRLVLPRMPAQLRSFPLVRI